MQQELLIKVLGMTTSVHDGEALAAIRKANDLLKTAGVTWREYIEAVEITRNAKQTGHQQRQQTKDFTDLYDDEEVEKMIDHLMKTVHPSSSFRSWVESVNQQFQTGRSLSGRQVEVLRKSTARSRGHF